MSTPTALRPDTDGYAEAVASFSLLQVPRPQRVVVAHDVAGVQHAIREAMDAGLRVAAFSTGHAAGRLGAADDLLLVRVRPAGPVRIDPAARIAVVPAGTLWRDVVVAAEAHGLLAPHGSSGTVGVAGYLLNGGLGFTARTIGVASNSLTAVEYVGADGALHRADAEHEPERFWALRGGGAGIGVVTSVEVRLRPGKRIVTGVRVWTAEHATALLRAWRDWCADAPRTITTTARILNLPPLPHLPPVLTSGPVVAIDGVVLDGEGVDGGAVADGLLAPLTRIAAPVLDTWHPGSPVDALATHMDPPEPAPAWTTHDLIGDLPDGAIDAFVAAGTGPSPLLSHELRQLGGAVAHPEEPGGFFDRVAEPFLFNGVAIAPVPGALAAAKAHVEALRGRFDALASNRCVPTFLESAADPRLAADEATMARLVAIRAEADPKGLFAVRP